MCSSQHMREHRICHGLDCFEIYRDNSFELHWKDEENRYTTFYEQRHLNSLT